MDPNLSSSQKDLYGYLSVLGAVIFFGSFAVPLKTRRIVEAKVDPTIFQLYMSFSIFCCSFLVLTYNKWIFTYFGIIGAALWVPASILSIFAINLAGLSIAVGTWAGVTIVVSFLWGALEMGTPVHSLALSIVALGLMILGIAGLSFSGTQFVKNIRRTKRDHQIQEDERVNLVYNDLGETPDDEPNGSVKRKIAGLACAVALGILNGSMMVPLKKAPAESGGVIYIVSFGIGVMAVTPVCVGLFLLGQYCLTKEFPALHFRIAFIPGFISGFIWSLGNWCSVYATIYLGLTIGFPLTQTALVVSGLWGIIVFKEMTGFFPILFWTISVMILLTGAFLLSMYG
eukprot:TRINITY_DN5475_c0_g1_i1.p1 TRINITY_DN5475_c0_g1~~TRINITY_DN5475_c0_g1_i1.p1  ORF type:complete len:343 (-),score=79.59 TRINITY_DN5475_c0_g1_i1:69-1097(-)